ncbi:uncharacterized protein [Vulpes vulpes]|uniref:Uncharacterized protein isoform X1 n=1 Tax=Vulpes vulpes TaxID=9627 RepID=A0ABM5A8F5_VULVU
MNQMTYRRTLPVPAPKCHTMAAFLKGISDHKSGSVFSFRQDRTFRIFNDRTVKQLCGLPFLGKPVMDAGKSKIKALANLMSGTNPFNKHLCTPAMYEALHLLLETHNQTSFHSCLQETQSLSSLVLIIGFFGEGLLKDRVRTGFWFGSTLLTTEMLMCKLYEHLFSAIHMIGQWRHIKWACNGGCAWTLQHGTLSSSLIHLPYHCGCNLPIAEALLNSQYETKS